MFVIISPTLSVFTAELFIDDDPTNPYKAIPITISNYRSFNGYDLTADEALALAAYLLKAPETIQGGLALSIA